MLALRRLSDSSARGVLTFLPLSLEGKKSVKGVRSAHCDLCCLPQPFVARLKVTAWRLLLTFKHHTTLASLRLQPRQEFYSRSLCRVRSCSHSGAFPSGFAGRGFLYSRFYSFGGEKRYFCAGSAFFFAWSAFSLRINLAWTSSIMTFAIALSWIIKGLA